MELSVRVDGQEGVTMKNSNEIFGIIGLGRFGFAFARTVAEEGKEIIVLDNDEQKIKAATAFTDNAFMVGSLTKENLQETGIQNCDVVMVCIGEAIDTSILTTLIVIQLGVKRVISKAISAEHGCVLEKLGAEVVYPERDMAIRTANILLNPRVIDYISLSDEVDILEISISDRIGGASITDLDIRMKFNLNIIAVKHNGELNFEIKPDMVLHGGDSVVVVGKHRNLEQFEKYVD
jgi:trk system potassium uptake protein TrkA